MKKILYVTTVSSTVNTFLIPHIKKLKESGYIVEIACNIDSKISNEVKHSKISFSRNPLSISNIRAIKEIIKLFKANKYDIVHVHTPVAAFITRLALRNFQVKIIYTSHGFHFYKGSPLLNWLIYYPIEIIAAKWTDRMVTINMEDYKRAKAFKLRGNGEVKLIRGVGIDSLEIDNKKIDIESKRRALALDKDDYVILVLSELNKNKNINQGIEAINILREDYPKIKLICAGKGPLERVLNEKVRKLKLENQIKFIGFRNDIDDLIAMSNAVALFSKREGLGKCLLEGIQGGIPIISTNNRGAREIIRNNINGLIVPINDYNKTAEAISIIYDNPEIGNKFAKRSKEIINEYLLTSVLDKVLELYDFKEEW